MTLPLLTAHFFMTPPFSAVSKSCDPPSVSTPPPPLLISDKSLKHVDFLKVLPFSFPLPVASSRFALEKHFELYLWASL